ncbi:hypothetical protein [Gayadomonas joobiniege]|uniref:hypothetical protein n=1 Tax=Gayadomonas joobiniege TaxID=1234606 RepID=UPI00036A5EAD|nr:hypothetical protein [Gayadomonas joobiniege]
MKKRQNERRKKTDQVILWRHYINILCWLSLCLSLVWLWLAAPDRVPGYARYKEVESSFRLEWASGYLDLLSIQLICCILLSCIGIWLNLKRLKRSTDHFHINVPVILATSVAAFGWVKLALS